MWYLHPYVCSTFNSVPFDSLFNTTFSEVFALALAYGILAAMMNLNLCTDKNILVIQVIKRISHT